MFWPLFALLWAHVGEGAWTSFSVRDKPLSEPPSSLSTWHDAVPLDDDARLGSSLWGVDMRDVEVNVADGRSSRAYPI